MIKVCVFDLDGTVMDTLESIAYFVNATMEKMNLSRIETEKFKYFAGDGRMVLLKKSLAHNNADAPENLQKAIKIYDSAYEGNFMHLTKPFDGIKQELLKIKAMGIEVAVLSNKPDNVVRAIINETFGNDFFAYVAGQREGVKNKPAPDGFLSVAESLGAKPEECVMIGDTDVDMQTGKNAGAHSVGVLWGFRTRRELEENGAQIIVDRVTDLAHSIAILENNINI